MSFDVVTISAIRQELLQGIVGGRVQGLLLPGPLSLSMEIYNPGSGRTHLLISAHPQHARIHLLNSAPTRDPEQHPPLLLLLRKYVKGGTITDVRQPSYERLLELSIAKRFWPDKHQEYHSGGDFRHSQESSDEDESAPVITVHLIVEVMGRLSNIVLVDENGVVLDGIKRIPPSLNRYRTTLPHQPYILPPPQDKRDPSYLTVNTLALALYKGEENEPGTSAWKALVGGVSGVSPTLAREALFRSLGATTHKAAEIAPQAELLRSLLGLLQSMLDPRQMPELSPTVAWREKEGQRQPLDFAPYRLTHLEAAGAQLQECRTLSEAITVYFSGLQELGGHSALKAQVLADIDDMRSREERKLFALREELERSQALEELRRKGEFLLAYMHTLQPGQTRLEIPDESLTIDLDMGLTPSENAQAIFREYRKARSAHEGLPDRVADVEMRLAFFDEMQTSLDLARTYDDIRAVQAEVNSARASRGKAPVEGLKQGKAKSKARKGQEKLPQPMRLRTHYGAQMFVGRTASQNDTATFRLADSADLWFHARGVPGSHVILRTGGGISQSDIEEAAQIAAGHSKARNEAQVDVICTERKNVRKVPNSPPGFVTFKNERVIRVAPRRAQP